MKRKMTTMFFVADGATIHGCGCLVLFLAQAYHRGMQFLFCTVWCERSEKKNRKISRRDNWMLKRADPGNLRNYQLVMDKTGLKYWMIYTKTRASHMTLRMRLIFFLSTSNLEPSWWRLADVHLFILILIYFIYWWFFLVLWYIHASKVWFAPLNLQQNLKTTSK